MNCAYLAEGKVSGNLVKNCDGLGSYDFCSVYKENNGNSKHHMRRKFLAFTNDIKHTAICHILAHVILSTVELSYRMRGHGTYIQ